MKIEELSNGFVVSNADDVTLRASYYSTKAEAVIEAKKLLDRWEKRETV